MEEEEARQQKELALWLLMRVHRRRQARREAILKPLDEALSGGRISEDELIRVMRLLALVQDKSDADLSNLALLFADDADPPDLITVLASLSGDSEDGIH